MWLGVSIGIFRIVSKKLKCPIRPYPIVTRDFSRRFATMPVNTILGNRAAPGFQFAMRKRISDFISYGLPIIVVQHLRMDMEKQVLNSKVWTCPAFIV